MLPFGATRSKFAREVVAPRAQEYDKSMKYPQDIFAQAWELGLCNGHIPEVRRCARDACGDRPEAGTGLWSPMSGGLLVGRLDGSCVGG